MPPDKKADDRGRIPPPPTRDGTARNMNGRNFQEKTGQDMSRQQRTNQSANDDDSREFNNQEFTGGQDFGRQDSQNYGRQSSGRASDRSPGRSITRNITDTEGWKSGQKGVQRFWSNYKKLLVDSFNRMTRTEQEDLIDKFAMIITIGVTCLIVLIFYPVVPRLLRVVGLPAALLAAWWAGRRIVAPVVIDRMSHLLKAEEREEFVEETRDR